MILTIKAVWLAMLDGDFKSAWTLLNYKKNRQFIKTIEDLLEDNSNQDAQ